MALNRIIHFSQNYLYVCLAACLVLFEGVKISEGMWVGDFWEHSAVVKELSENILKPGNPILNSDIPHAFYSPYALLVACWVKLFSLTSIDALGHFAFINLVLLVTAIHVFCKALFKDNSGLVSTLTLLFTLFFWGENPPGWSGFYHIFDLHHVLPYPSAFAYILSLFALASVIQNKNRKKTIHYVLVALAGAVIFLSHPSTGVFYFTVLGVFQLLDTDQTFYRRIVKCLVYILPAVLLCLIWPYYSFPDLLLSSNEDFNLHSAWIYQGFLKAHWPSLLSIPLFWFAKRNKSVLFLAVSITALWLIFALGYVTEIYGVSRVMSNIMMFSFSLMAYGIILLYEVNLRLGVGYSFVVLFAFTVVLVSNRSKLKNEVFNLSKGKSCAYYERYSFIRSKVKTDELILSDEASNWIIPSYNGKVVSSIHPLYWVDDIYTRRYRVGAFFQSSMPDAERDRIFRIYQPDYILIDHNLDQVTDSMVFYMRRLGKTVAFENELELIRVKR